MKKKFIELRFTHQQIADITLAHLKLIREKLKHTDLNRFSYISWTFYISDERLEYCQTSIKAIIKFCRTTASQEIPINQLDAPREFLVRVVESVCGVGNYHSETSTVTFSI